MIKTLALLLVFASVSPWTVTAAPVYLGLFDGNDDLANVKTAILTATGLDVDITLYDKSDELPLLTSFTPNPPEGNLSGTWDLIDDSVVISYLTVKASDSFTLYAYDPPVNSGEWSTANILNRNGVQQELSHLSLWTVPRAGEVPEPSTAGLLIGGCAGLVAWSRARMRTSRVARK